MTRARTTARQRTIVRCALVALAVLAIAEAAVRWSGVTQVPLYRPDAELGYVLAPSQAGAWRNRMRWAVNEHGMPTARRFEPHADDIVVLGDSLVMGTLHTDLSQTLAARLKAETGRSVWPIAAGSWALTNELRALARVPEASKVGTLVVVSNPDDFSPPSIWESDATHPRSMPWSGIGFIVAKLHQRMTALPSLPAASPTQRIERDRLVERLLQSYRGRIVWAMYPRQDRLGCAAPELTTLARQVGGRATIIDVAAEPGWNVGLYRDIYHPNDAGNAMLARMITQKLSSSDVPTATPTSLTARPSCPVAADAA